MNHDCRSLCATAGLALSVLIKRLIQNINLRARHLAVLSAFIARASGEAAKWCYGEDAPLRRSI